MSGYQFVRTDTYSMSVPKLRLQREATWRELGKEFERKLTVEEICFEAARVPGNHPHIVEPAPPVVLYGMPPDQIPAWLQTKIDKQNALIAAQKKAMPRGARRGGPRAIRTDSPTLIAVVGSHPFFMKGDGTDYPSLDDPECRAAVEEWKADWVEWKLKEAAERGAIVISIVEHVDEGHPHLHAFEIAENLRLDARVAHPGFAAKRAVEAIEGEDEKDTVKRANTAYKAAMVLWQDDHHARVSVDHGLLRIGPRRRRLRRKIYLEEKKAADGLARNRAAESRESERYRLAAEERRLRAEEEEARCREAEAAGERMLDIYEDKLSASIGTLKKFKELSSSAEQEEAAAAARLADLRARSEAETATLAKIWEEHEKAAAVEADLKSRKIELAAIRAELVAAQARLRECTAQADRLAADRAAFDKNREDLDQRRVSHDEKERELDAKLLGLDAFFDGRLRVIPRPGQPPLLQCANDHADLQAKVMPAVEWLRARLYTLHVARRRTKLLASAIIRAARAWATGEIACIVPDRTTKGGKAVFGGLNAEPSKALIASLDPYHEAVTALIRSLPDRVAIDHIQFHAGELAPYLDAAAKKRASELNGGVANMARLVATRPPGRGGGGR
jgi:hypothetical protein